ncbi:MAG: DUF2380 domain-containing protein [Vulcanimicrobiota bacterium]
MQFITQDLAQGDYVSAGLDVVGMGVPGVTGVGQLSKPIRKAVYRIFNNLQVHHLFPQAQKLKPFFMKRGIDIEQYLTDLPKGYHIEKPNGVHVKPQGGTFEETWNGVWETWIAKNQNATKEQCIKQMEQMRKDFNIDYNPIHGR